MVTAPTGRFVGYWLDRLLFLDLDPAWFTVGYAAFFGLIVLTLFLIPVQRVEKAAARQGGAILTG